MSYPQQVPPGWTKGEPVKARGTGPRYAVERDWPLGAKVPHDEIAIEFDSREDCVAWLNWWQVKFEDVQALRSQLTATEAERDRWRFKWSVLAEASGASDKQLIALAARVERLGRALEGLIGYAEMLERKMCWSPPDAFVTNARAALSPQAEKLEKEGV